MGTICGLIGLGLCLWTCGVVAAATWYVDGSVSESGDGHSWETAFRSVQEGIEAASEGDTVLVGEGTYVENIRFLGAVPQEKTIFEENFDGYSNLYTNQDVTDAGWEVKNGCGDPNGAWRLWSVTGEPLRNQMPNLAGMTENYMITDSDQVPDVAVDEELITPEIDCAGWAKVRLEFSKNYRVYTEHRSDLQVAEVDIRVFDEGSGWGEWVNLLRYDSETVIEYDTTPEQVDLSEYADGRRVQIRWHFYLAEYDWWFAVDDVAISGEPANLVFSADTAAQTTEAENIILRSKDPFNPAVVAETVLDGGGAGCVVSFSGGEDENCVLAGFTIRNGNAQYGGGLYWCGGNLGGPLGTIRNNIIVDNEAATKGGGLSEGMAVIQNCRINRNSATDGGGLSGCQGTIESCEVCYNSAAGDGGGLHRWMGGIRNSTICRNTAGSEGGGLYRCLCHDEGLGNCIIWENVAPNGPQLHLSSDPVYSCILDWTTGGEGNIGEDPCFRDADHGDFRLSPASPCVNTGDTGAVVARRTDIAGSPRVMYGGRSFTVDMGAYEHYINELSTGPEANQATLTWSSLADVTYSIFYSADLMTWHLAIATFPSSGNQTTSWIDDGSLTGLPPFLVPRRFYRVLENP